MPWPMSTWFNRVKLHVHELQFLVIDNNSDNANKKRQREERQETPKVKHDLGQDTCPWQGGYIIKCGGKARGPFDR